MIRNIYFRLIEKAAWHDGNANSPFMFVASSGGGKTLHKL